MNASESPKAEIVSKEIVLIERRGIRTDIPYTFWWGEWMASRKGQNVRIEIPLVDACSSVRCFELRTGSFIGDACKLELAA